jgi:hypothetical protein
VGDGDPAGIEETAVEAEGEDNALPPDPPPQATPTTSTRPMKIADRAFL